MEEVIATNVQDDIQYLNRFVLTGSVVHKYRPKPDVIILTVAVKGRELHEADYPNVAFYGDMAATIDEHIDVDENDYPRVHVEGVIQTTRRETPDGVRFYQSLVGNTISRTSTQMENLTGIRGIGVHKAESENVVCLLGQVTSVRPITRADSDRPFGANVTLRTQTDGRTNFPRVTCFNGTVNPALALKPGDVVCFTGFMETMSRTREDGRRTRFESIIASELAVVKAAEEEKEAAEA